MQLSINRYFKHKYFDSVVKSSMRKSDNDSSKNPMHHLYIDLVEGDKIIGMGNAETFMLSTGLHQDDWREQLETWMHENQYVDYNPFRMDKDEASEFLTKCYEDIPKGLRLGQAIINNLGDKTPTPNIEIFASTDDDFVTQWFYANCVLED